MNRREFLTTLAVLYGCTVLPLPKSEPSIVGRHYSAIIVDDLVNDNYALTPEMLEKALKHFEKIDPQPTILMYSSEEANYFKELYRPIDEPKWRVRI